MFSLPTIQDVWYPRYILISEISGMVWSTQSIWILQFVTLRLILALPNNTERVGKNVNLFRASVSSCSIELEIRPRSWDWESSRATWKCSAYQEWIPCSKVTPIQGVVRENEAWGVSVACAQGKSTPSMFTFSCWIQNLADPESSIPPHLRFFFILFSLTGRADVLIPFCGFRGFCFSGIQAVSVTQFPLHSAM